MYITKFEIRDTGNGTLGKFYEGNDQQPKTVYGEDSVEFSENLFTFMIVAADIIDGAVGVYIAESGLMSEVDKWDLLRMANEWRLLNA